MREFLRAKPRACVFLCLLFRGCDGGTCLDKSNILYAWARNAPPTRLPKGMVFSFWDIPNDSSSDMEETMHYAFSKKCFYF